MGGKEDVQALIRTGTHLPCNVSCIPPNFPLLHTPPPQGAEDCLLFPTGFAANLSVLTTLAGTAAGGRMLIYMYIYPIYI